MSSLSDARFQVGLRFRPSGQAKRPVADPTVDTPAFAELVRESLESGELAVIVARRNCLLAAGQIKAYEKCDEQPE